MKFGRFHLLLIFGLFLFSPVITFCKPKENVAPNPGFETWSSGDANGWFFNGLNIQDDPETDIKYNGTYSSKITTTAEPMVGGSIYWSDPSTIIFSKYYFSARIFDNDSNIQVAIQIRAETFPSSGNIYETSSYTQNNNSWQIMEVSMTHPSDSYDIRTAFVIKAENYTSDGNVFVDEARCDTTPIIAEFSINLQIVSYLVFLPIIGYSIIIWKKKRKVKNAF